MRSAPVSPTPAATVVLLRDGPGGPEVLMLRRAAGSRFMPGAYVFPGGALDESDAAADVLALCAHIDDAAASLTLDVPRHGLAFLVGAIRECFEEAGILLALDAEDRPVQPVRWPVEDLLRMRRDLIEGRLSCHVLHRSAIALAVAELAYFSHWITPRELPIRFDTRFFVAAAPAQQTPCLASAEVDDLLWVRPALALAQFRSGELHLRSPTRATLEELARFGTVEAVLAYARSVRAILPNMPVLSKDGHAHDGNPR